MRWIAAILLSLSTSAAPALAQATQPVPASREIVRRDALTTTDTTISSGPSATRVAVSLAAVLGLIVALAVVAKKLAPRGRFAGVGQAGGAIHVMARTPISPKQKIILLQVGRRILVLADSAGQNLSTLCEIADFDEAAALISQLQTEKGGNSFSAALNDAMERFRSAQDKSPSTPTAHRPDLDSMRQEIEGLAQRVRGMAR
jgi:flagellar biogenesis protein FliO